MPVTSILDSDFYKFTMGNAIFKHFRNVPVEYTLTDRRKQKLATVIPPEKLRDELDRIKTLRVTKSELHYLRGTNEYNDRMFPEDYLQFLSELKLPEYRLGIVDGNFQLRFFGKWSEAIYWETLALSTINELYYNELMKDYTRLERDVVNSTGVLNLSYKVKRLNTLKDLKIVDFGTRRRFSQKWQWYVIEQCRNMPWFVGTSNTRAAMEFDLLPMGTYAHEMDMGFGAIYRAIHPSGCHEQSAIHESHRKVLSLWWELYGHGLSVALTDTYGSDYFFKTFGEENAKNWKGVRHDSGDPFVFGERVINYYESLGIDPKSKLLIFSDGLNIDDIECLYARFINRIGISFGWGTTFTNDLGFENLHIVVKLSKALDVGTVKLSDNPGKEMGFLNDIDLFKRACF